MNCKKCGTEILEANAVFCSKCGQRLDGKKSCKKCGKIVDETDSFCPFCGEKFKGKEKNEKFFNTERLKKVSLLGDVSFFINSVYTDLTSRTEPA